MDRKIELRVVNIKNNQGQVGMFSILLAEVNGERQLPIIIGPEVAQATALYLKGIQTPRPLTHDLLATCISILGSRLIRVLIYSVKDAVFYAYLYLQKDDEIIRIDARTSDAIALAVRFVCPIFIYESILEQECVHNASAEKKYRQETDDEDHDDNEAEEHRPPTTTYASLEDALQQAIKEEDYERAARIRDQINSKNQNQ